MSMRKLCWRGSTAMLLASSLAAQTPPRPPATPIESITEPPRLPETRETEEPEEPERDEWETDRDSFTPSTKTAGAGRLIVETAYSFLDNRGRPETHSYPELLFRYGLNKRFELRLGWNREVGGGASSISGGGGDEGLSREGISAETNINYGFKLGLTDQRGWLPQSAFIASGYTPTSGPDTATQFICNYVFGWELPNRWILDSSLRYSADSEEHDRFNHWAPSVVLKAPLGDKWDAHVEYFGIFSDGKERESVLHYISPGLHCLLTENTEVGVRVGWGLNDQSARFFVNAGAGLRF